MNTAIIYKSQHGSTEQYAKWLQEALPDAELFRMENFPHASLKKFDTIIIGSYEYCGDIPAYEFIKAVWDKIKDKKVFLFAVGAIPAESQYSQQTYQTLPQEIRKQVK